MSHTDDPLKSDIFFIGYLQGLLSTWVRTPTGTGRSFFEQETLHSLLSIDWFQDRLKSDLYKLLELVSQSSLKMFKPYSDVIFAKGVTVH